MFPLSEVLARFGVAVPESLLNSFDQVIQAQGYTNRSEAIRDLIRDKLVKETWESGRGEVIGALTLVYDHHSREVQERLTQLQHDFHAVVVSTLHVHLDAHNCLEVIVLRGAGKDIKKMSNALISQTGVVHGQLAVTAVAKGAGHAHS